LFFKQDATCTDIFCITLCMIACCVLFKKQLGLSEWGNLWKDWSCYWKILAHSALRKISIFDLIVHFLANSWFILFLLFYKVEAIIFLAILQVVNFN